MKVGWLMTIIKNTKGKGLEKLIDFIKGIDKQEVFVGVTKDTNARPDGGSNAIIGIVHEFGSVKKNIPERSHLRATILENADKYAKIIAEQIPQAIKSGMKPYDAYANLGTIVSNDVKLRIVSGSYAPLNPKTIKAKGSSKPLIDDGYYRQSITYRVDL